MTASPAARVPTVGLPLGARSAVRTPCSMTRRTAARRLQYVGLVDRHQLLLPPARGFTGDPGDAPDFLDGVDAEVAGAIGLALLLAEVDAARQLPDDDHVDTDQALRPQGRGVDE